MKKYFVAATAAMVFGALALMAADIDGTWTREAQGRGGTQTQKLMLKADGSTLTGSMDAGFGGAADISNGKIDGNNVSFTVVRDFGGNSVTINYKGMLSGNELKLTQEVQGGGFGKGKGGKGGKGKGGGEQVFTKAN